MLAWLFNLSLWESPTHRVVRRNQRGDGCRRASACCTAPSKDALAPLRPPSPYRLPRPPRRAGAANGIYANARTRMAGRARGPAAPAPHLESGGPPAQKSRPGSLHRRSLGSSEVRGMGRPGGAGGDAALAAGRLVAAQCLSSSSLPISAFISQFLLICSPSLQVLLPTSIRELLFPLSITPARVEHFCVPDSALGTGVGYTRRRVRRCGVCPQGFGAGEQALFWLGIREEEAFELSSRNG